MSHLSFLLHAMQRAICAFADRRKQINTGYEVSCVLCSCVPRPPAYPAMPRMQGCVAAQGRAGQLAMERRGDLHRHRAHAQPDVRPAQDAPGRPPVPARQARQVRSPLHTVSVLFEGVCGPALGCLSFQCAEVEVPNIQHETLKHVPCLEACLVTHCCQASRHRQNSRAARAVMS